MRKVFTGVVMIVLLLGVNIVWGAEKIVCPVEGDAINPQHAVRHEYKGNTYTFCCQDCVAKFKADPAQYIGKQQQPLSGEIKNGVREIKVVAKKFEFVPDPIGVKQGEKVRLIVTTPDVTHGIGIKEYKINRTVEKGKDEIIEFTADKAGTFTVSCTVYCGGGHSAMKGKLIVYPTSSREHAEPNSSAEDTHKHHSH